LRRYFSRKPSPSLVLSMIALFVALGGVSYGLAGKNTVASDDIVNGGVKSKDIKNSGVKSKDINLGGVKSSDVANDTLVGEDINENTLDRVPRASEANRAENADNADNADNLGGSPPSDFATSNIVRWATVNADGTVVAAQSHGITQANITHPSTGRYCIVGLDPAPTAATATRRFGGTFGQIFVEIDLSGGACTDAQGAVATYNNNTPPGGANNAFTLVIY
jgi:hypothetical protein